jgi:g-D-glutamyl-meso-diaminopimelate peptidase
MLNPDGVEYQINGVMEDNILFERLVKMNGGSRDFSCWQANGRGVDLNHNYCVGFSEYKLIEEKEGIYNGAATKYSGNSPESEPETAAVCAFLRRNDNIRTVISLHTQGEEIFYSSKDSVAHRSNVLAHTFSRISGYKLSRPEGSAAYGGLLDFCIGELKLPAFTIECGKGKNPLPLGDYLSIYADLKELLFIAPTMI